MAGIQADGQIEQDGGGIEQQEFLDLPPYLPAPACQNRAQNKVAGDHEEERYG